MFKIILLAFLILQFQSAIILVPLSFENSTTNATTSNTVNTTITANSTLVANTTNTTNTTSIVTTNTTTLVNNASSTNTQTQNTQSSNQNNINKKNNQENPSSQDTKNSFENKKSNKPLLINLLQNSDFESDKLPLQTKSISASRWNLVDSYLINGVDVTPKWTTKIGLLGLQCKSKVVISLPNRKYNSISQVITLTKAQRLVLTFTYGLVSLASNVPVTRSISNTTLWVTFNEKIVALNANSKIQTFTMQVNGVMGKNTLNFHGLSNQFSCDGNQFVALDNVILQAN